MRTIHNNADELINCDVLLRSGRTIRMTLLEQTFIQRNECQKCITSRRITQEEILEPMDAADLSLGQTPDEIQNALQKD